MTKIKLWFVISSLLLSSVFQLNGTIIKIFAAKCIHKCLIVSKVLRAAAISIDNILSQPPHRTVYLKKVKDIVAELNKVDVAQRSPYFDIFAKGLILDPERKFFISINPTPNHLEFYCNGSPEENRSFLEDSIITLLQHQSLVNKHQLCIKINLSPKASFWLKNYKLAILSQSQIPNFETSANKINLCDKILEKHPLLKLFTDDPSTVPHPQEQPQFYFHHLLFSIPETKKMAKALFLRKKLN